MFTGIIQAVGRVIAIEPKAGDMRLRIDGGELELGDVAVGDSIATSGVCLTAVTVDGGRFLADVSIETLARTTLGRLQLGHEVNLEKALTPTTCLGGHLVSGHVDGVGRVLDRRSDGRSWRFQIEAPKALARYIAQKGSICIDGVSLTVSAVAGAVFEVNIVPHTLERTTIKHYTAGTQVNLEVDLIARYLERLLLGDDAAQAGGLTREFLARHGFA